MGPVSFRKKMGHFHIQKNAQVPAFHTFGAEGTLLEVPSRGPIGCIRPWGVMHGEVVHGEVVQGGTLLPGTLEGTLLEVTLLNETLLNLVPWLSVPLW